MTPRLARVRAVLAANARLADPRDPLGAEARARLPAATGLSPEGVALALEAHLERSATEDELTALVDSVGEAARVHVVLSANVFVAASRAVALALAASARVVVRPSRREPVFPELLVRALDDGGLDAEVVLARGVTPLAGEAIHAYGRDATLRAIATSLPPGVALWGHGSGLGVVAIDEGADAAALARDVIAFDQRGCLSPRVVLVRASEDDVVRFAASLSAELVRLAERVPIGVVDHADRASRRVYLDTVAMIGRVFGGEGAHVGVDLSPRALIVPEAPRVVHVVRVVDAGAAWSLALPVAGKIAALGGEGPLAEALASRLSHARRSALGAMQRPPFDGPVDRRRGSSLPARAVLRARVLVPRRPLS